MQTCPFPPSGVCCLCYYSIPQAHLPDQLAIPHTRRVYPLTDCKTVYRTESLFLRTITEWNNLPPEVTFIFLAGTLQNLGISHPVTPSRFRTTSHAMPFEFEEEWDKMKFEGPERETSEKQNF